MMNNVGLTRRATRRNAVTFLCFNGLLLVLGWWFLLAAPIPSEEPIVVVGPSSTARSESNEENHNSSPVPELQKEQPNHVLVNQEETTARDRSHHPLNAAEKKSIASLLFQPEYKCGQTVLDALRLRLEVTPPTEPVLVPHNKVVEGGGDALSSSAAAWFFPFRIVLSNGSLSYRNLQLVGRGLSPHAIVSGATSTQQPDGSYLLWIGPLPSSSSSSEKEKENEEERFMTVDVRLTWVNDRYLGQRWFLPNRNDNPPFEEMKRKCLALTLKGNCDRFGVALWKGTLPLTPPRLLAGEREGNRLPWCTGSMVGGAGLWRPVAATAALERDLLDDPVGLNRDGNGTVWKWDRSPYCRIGIRSAEEVYECLAAQQTLSIALFGDSMMLELFNMLVNLFRASPRQAKFKKMRMKEFRYVHPKHGGRPLVVRFSRSYTTHEGQSVLATARTIVQQLEQSHPDVIVGNMAVLHYQQNMLSEDQWERALQKLTQKLESHGSLRHVLEKGRAFFAGPTLIQMGRTQGLEPSRTDSFALIAKKVLKKFHFFDPYAMSVARRESAFDGEHWACYHRYGGVSQQIAQMFLQQLCAPTASD